MPTTTTRRQRNSRQSRRERQASSSAPPYITRRIPPYELLDEAGLIALEENAETLLEEIGIEFRGDAEVLAIWRQAGAKVDGERVYFPRGMLRGIIQATTPAQFTQHARNPARSVPIGGNHTVFVPAYGSPFVRDLDQGRRYASLEDFQNLIKLAYGSPYLHHSGGTICEPVDVPVNKRHLDMLYSHIRYSDKAFMGSVTAPERAEDSVAMAKILFGEDFVDNNCVLLAIINVNSPLVFDATMLGALKVYARANQANIITPFILGGAMGPVTLGGAISQTLAEAMAGIALTQLLRPGTPVIMGAFTSSLSLRSGAPTFGMPEPALSYLAIGQLARRLGVPWRGGGSLTASKISDAQAGQESADTLFPTLLGGVNLVMQSAGWLEGGLTMGYEKFILDMDHLGMMHTLANGVDLSANGLALDAYREMGPGRHYLGCSHTLANYQTAFYDSLTADNNSFEQWRDAGEADATQRAYQIWTQRLADYQAPALDEGMDEALWGFIQQRKSSMADAWH